MFFNSSFKNFKFGTTGGAEQVSLLVDVHFAILLFRVFV